MVRFSSYILHGSYAGARRVCVRVHRHTYTNAGRSDSEIQRFCQSFMTELYRHIGPNLDIPAGDINVGSREIGYLYGQYKRIVNRVECICTGKGVVYGGSHVREQATGFGVIYFLQNVLSRYGVQNLQSIRVAISGAGNVALYAAYKLLQLQATVVAVSDSNGCLLFDGGMTWDHWKQIHMVKTGAKGSVEKLLDTFDDVQFLPHEKPWRNCECDIAIPCATQNEVDEGDVAYLLQHSCRCVIEGANMPCTMQAMKMLLQKQVLYIPGKASNAGGVAVSGLEMAQNASKMP
uniref:glutamate dehydrogenase (NADP(+)) n=2 Tax=Lygus hesperus TaxID=30085 RepID=A0A146LGZ4_LYGHE